MNLDTPKGVQLFKDPYSKYTIKQENREIEKDFQFKDNVWI